MRRNQALPDNLLMFLLRVSDRKVRERFVLPTGELDRLIEHELKMARRRNKPVRRNSDTVN